MKKYIVMTSETGIGAYTKPIAIGTYDYQDQAISVVDDEIDAFIVQRTDSQGKCNYTADHVLQNVVKNDGTFKKEWSIQCLDLEALGLL